MPFIIAQIVGAPVWRSGLVIRAKRGRRMIPWSLSYIGSRLRILEAKGTRIIGSNWFYIEFIFPLKGKFYTIPLVETRAFLGEALFANVQIQAHVGVCCHSHK